MNAIVRRPSPAFAQAISSHPERDRIDPAAALAEHREFVRALRDAGATVHELAPDPNLPDAPFVSDTLVALTPAREPVAPATLLVLTRPAEPQRRGEVASVAASARAIVAHDTRVVEVEAPATLEGGDVLVYGDRIAIGLSRRTNEAGAHRLAEEAAVLGYRPFLCPVDDRLHLASAITALGPDRLVGTAAGFASVEAAGLDALDGVERVLLEDRDAAAANVLVVRDTAIVAAGHPAAAAAIRDADVDVVEVRIDQFVRADGGPTCLVALVP